MRTSDNIVWHPIPLPVVRDAWSTPYGFMIDHLWRCAGSVARRPHWPKGMSISVQPCEDLDEQTEANCNIGAMTQWVFFDDGEIYGAPQEDLEATDWVVSDA